MKIGRDFIDQVPVVIEHYGKYFVERRYPTGIRWTPVRKKARVFINTHEAEAFKMDTWGKWKDEPFYQNLRIVAADLEGVTNERPIVG